MTKRDEDEGLTFARTLGVTGPGITRQNIELNAVDIAQYDKSLLDNVTYRAGELKTAAQQESSGMSMGALLAIGLVAYVAFASS